VRFLASEVPLSGRVPTLWGYNPVSDNQRDFTQSRPLYEDTGPHVLLTHFRLSKALLAHDVYACLERPSGDRECHARPFVGVFKSQFYKIFRQTWALLARS